MFGKVLKVASNDLYGNVDDRVVRVYACFEHIKYMNNYVVFSFDGDNSKLCFGSIHLKDKSLVIFSVNDNIKQYIMDFVNEFLNNKLSEFKLLKLDNIEKVELVSYNDIDFDKLTLLDDKSIPKVVVKEEIEKESKPVFMYILIFLLILLGSGLTLLYFKPDLFTVKYKMLECSNNIYDKNLNLNYDINKTIKFNQEDKVDSIDNIRTYTFLDSGLYYEFKDSDNQKKYFTNGEGYKYIDEELKFKVFYKEASVIDDYDEISVYLKNDGYDCVESVYEK